MRNQITCTCPAYHFPHRLSGGKCKIEDFCNRKHLENFGMAECSNCNSYVDFECEVATGRESASECQIVQELESFHEIKLYKRRTQNE